MSELKIFYCTDALCGWCFGISDNITKIYNEFSSKVEFELVNGGLFVGERVGPINSVAPYIKQGAYKSVESVTGTLFGEEFLKVLNEDKEMILNSLYPAIGSVIILDHDPKKVFEFQSKLHKAYYIDGVNPEDKEALAGLIESMGVIKTSAMDLINDEKYKTMALEQFKKCKEIGVRSYPTLLITIDNKILNSFNGYQSYDVLKNAIEEHL